MDEKKNIQWMIIPITTLFVLLFFPLPNYNKNAIYVEFLQLGHFFLFVGIFFFLNYDFLEKKVPSFFGQLFINIALCLGLAFMTEAIQFFIGRNFEFLDLLNDCIGALVGFTLASLFKNNKTHTFILKIIIIIFLMIFTFKSLLIAVYDRWQMNNEFPVISDFESKSQLKRWRSQDVIFSLSDKQSFQGKNSLKLIFSQKKYPTIHLQNFISNWRNYKEFKFSIFNPKAQSVKLNLTIADKAHYHRGYQHFDRFNREFIVNQGWNTYNIDLKTIQDSPKNRQLDLSEIDLVYWFLSSPKQETELFIDHINLTQ